MLRIFCTEIDRLMQRLGEERGIRRGASGAVASIQYFGGSLNLNPHYRVAVLDGVYSTSMDGTRVVFTNTRSPSMGELEAVIERVYRRVIRWLRRRGFLDNEPEQEKEPSEPSPVRACAQLSLRLGKLGYVDRDGVAHEPDPDHARFGMRRGTPWSAQHEGWNLHAGVTIGQGDYEGRESLCRYMLRHALSLERLSFTQDGRVAYAVKYPRSPTRTHLLLETLQLLARVASLIPPPRHPLVRYRGVLSSASRWRQHVVPKKKRVPSPGKKPPSHEHRGARTPDSSSSTLLADEAKPAAVPTRSTREISRGAMQAANRYIDWHTLLARVCDLDSLVCPRCGGQLRMIAVLIDRQPVRAILESMGLRSTPPRARPSEIPDAL